MGRVRTALRNLPLICPQKRDAATIEVIATTTPVVTTGNEVAQGRLVRVVDHGLTERDQAEILAKGKRRI